MAKRLGSAKPAAEDLPEFVSSMGPNTCYMPNMCIYRYVHTYTYIQVIYSSYMDTYIYLYIYIYVICEYLYVYIHVFVCIRFTFIYAVLPIITHTIGWFMVEMIVDLQVNCKVHHHV